MKIEISIPAECEQYANDIRRFVDAMLYKLKVHAKKGRWDDLPLPQALHLLLKEYDELEAAVKEGNTVEVMMEAADVANFAMIVASIQVERGQ